LKENTMNPTHPAMTVLAACVMACAQPALADEGPAAWAFGADVLDSEAFGFGQAESARVVKGAPYCADAQRETVQTLADGNRIVRSSSTRLCRDGEGRTRQEVERGGKKLIWLRDPVAKQTWLLDPERKTARRQLGGQLLSQWHDGQAGQAWREDFSQRMKEFAERMREWSRGVGREAGQTAPSSPVLPALPVLPVPPVPPVPSAAPNAPVVIHEHHVRDAQGRDTVRTQLQVLRLEADAAGLPKLPWLNAMPMPPAVSWRAQTFAPRGPGVISALGSKDIEGVRANGERTTWTIEAGKVGNEKPIVITRDVWTSPELMVTLLTTDNDPRSGQTIYRLAKLQRGEPDAALMRVPEDYSSTPALRSKTKP
jgi:hypothetical protein